MSIDDPEVSKLAALSQGMVEDYVNLDVERVWAKSPFAWIRQRPSRQRGKIGENLLAGYFAAKGFNVTRSPDSDADKVIEGVRVEIKMPTLWGNGTLTFQQFRDQNYKLAFCLGLLPFDAHLWVVPKGIVMEHATNQHGGQAGSDTKWVKFSPDSPPDWISPYGGSLKEGVASFKKLLRSK